MKNLAYFLFNFFFLTHFAFTGDINAQSERDNEKVTITITKNVNGEESVQTNTFDLNDFDMDEIMEKIDIDMEQLEKSLENLGEKFNEFDIDVDVDIQGLDQMENAFEEAYQISVDIDDDGKEKKVVKIKHGVKSDKGFLGVVPDKHENGVLIKEVVKGSAAETAGIQAGDVITSINGNSINEMDDLYEALKATKQGDKVKVKYNRDGKVSTAKATLGEYPAKEMAMHKKMCVPSPTCNKAPEHGFLGVYMEDSEEGVLVEEVVEGSPAEKAGVKAGDVLTNLNGKKVDSDKQVFAVMKTTKPGDNMKVDVVRDGQSISLNAKLGQVKQKEHKMEWKSIEIERPFLGVIMDESESSEGVMIKEVVENSAADNAGIKSGDIIRSINNIQTNSIEDVIKEIRDKKSGDNISLLLDRGGDIQNVTATLKSKKFSHCGEEWSKNKGNFDIEIDEQGNKKIIKVTSPNGEDVIEKVIEFEEGEEGAGEGMEFMLNEAETVEDPSRVNKVNNTLEVDNLNLFPNPNDGKFKLTFGLAEKGNTEIMILDSKGREVYKEIMEGFSGNYDKSLDLSENSTGTYVIQISQNGKVLSDRIIIQ